MKCLVKGAELTSGGSGPNRRDCTKNSAQIGRPRRTLGLLLGGALTCAAFSPNTYALSDSPASLCWPDTASPPTANCPSFSWIPIAIQGAVGRDFEIEGGQDPSNGGANVTPTYTDMSSGFLDGTTVEPNNNCWPTGTPKQDNCGPEPTGFWACATVPDDDATPGDLTDNPTRTRVYLRMRVNGDPRTQTGGSTEAKPDFNSSHWNHLFSTIIDTPVDFKEFWIDLFGGFNSGNPDQLRIIYEDTDSNAVTNDDEADAATGTFINAFTACGAQGLAACQTTVAVNGVAGIELSHGRVLTAINQFGGDDPDEYWVDIQIPLTEIDRDVAGNPTLPVLTLNTDAIYDEGIGGGGVPNANSWPGSGADSIAQRGTQVIVSCDQAAGPDASVAFVYSTSASNIDPVQKDLIFLGFSDTTLASVGYFEAKRTGVGVRFDWQTTSEMGNAGFDIYENTPSGGWRRINDALIPGKVDSDEPQDYSFEATGVSGTQFMLVDVDLDEKRHRNGPYKIDQAYGEPLSLDPIDWPTIEAQHDGKKKQRISKRQNELRKHHGRDSVASGVGKRANTVTTTPTAVAGQTPLMNIVVETDGIYRVGYDALRAAGLDLAGVDVDQLALTYRSEPVPIRVSTPNGAAFGSGAYIEFIGLAADSIYTRKNVYQLQVDGALAQRVAVDSRTVKKAKTSIYQETVTVNNNVAYAFTSPNPEDAWFERTLLARGGPTGANFSIPVDHLVPDTAATLRLDVWGAGNFAPDPDHHLIVEFNGVLVAEEYFDGNVGLPLEIPLAAGLVQEGTNTLTLRVPGDIAGTPWDQIRVNDYGLTYTRSAVARNSALVFDAKASALAVDGFASSDVVAYHTVGGAVTYLEGTKLTGGSSGFSATVNGTGGSTARYYLATAASLPQATLEPPAPFEDILSGDAGYLVISHPDFVPGLDPLVAARETAFSVKVVDVEQIYAQLAGGNVDPGAIRDYISHAVATMGTRSVLLVGGDTYDYFDYLGTGAISFIPTPYTDLGSLGHHTPVDSWYVDGDGDNVPDAAIGRLPAKTDQELSLLIQKTLDFAVAGHHNKAVLAADDHDGRFNFTEMSEAMAAQIPGNVSVQKIYLDQYMADFGAAAGQQKAHSDLVAALNLGDAAMVSYIGHSGPFTWTANNPFLLFSGDAAALTNSGRPQFVAQWGCWMDHLNPRFSTLTHRLLFNANGGAAAVFGLAGSGSGTSDALLAPLAQGAIMQQGATVGASIQSAKAELAAENPTLLDVIVGGTLLGDPALIVNP